MSMVLACEGLMLRLFGWRYLILNGDPFVSDRSLFFAPWFLPPSPDVRTLDAGCGNGCFTMQAARRSGGIALGVSENQAQIAKARDRARVLGVDDVRFEIFDLRDQDRYEEMGTFDQVLLMETIEHVLDDEALLRLVRARIRPGGRLLLSTPSDDHPPLYGEGRSLSGGIEDGRHVRWGYSRDGLVQLLGQAGFEVAFVGPIGGVCSRLTTSLINRLAESVGLAAAMAATFPLRLLRVVDPAVTRILRLSSQSWGIVAINPPSD